MPFRHVHPNSNISETAKPPFLTSGSPASGARLILKVNTGGGKTVIGLLILQSCLNEGVGPALYVAPDNYLVEQVQQQAEELGLETTDGPDDRRYLDGTCIAVVNISKLMNAKSVFGGPASLRPNPFAIGSMVVDDVHAALATAAEQFTLTFQSDSGIYSSLLDLFKEALGEQSPGGLVALEAGDSAVLPLLVPFWEWAKHSGTGLHRCCKPAVSKRK